MTPRDALDRIRARLDAMNANEQACALPALQDADKTWTQRHVEIVVCLAHMLDEPPYMPRLEAAGAHLVALMVAVDEAELMRVETGEAA